MCSLLLANDNVDIAIANLLVKFNLHLIFEL